MEKTYAQIEEEFWAKIRIHNQYLDKIDAKKWFYKKSDKYHEIKEQCNQDLKEMVEAKQLREKWKKSAAKWSDTLADELKKQEKQAM